MADDAQSIGALNWRELFPFTHLFRAFRVAFHPSKLVLGFALLLLVYAGGRFLDAIWPRSEYAISHEIEGYEAMRWAHETPRSFADERLEERRARDERYAQELVDHGIVKGMAEAREAAKSDRYFSRLEESAVRERNDAIADADKALSERLKAIADEKLSEEDRPRRVREANEQRDRAIRDAYTTREKRRLDLDLLRLHPVFDSLFRYEAAQFQGVLSGALTLSWFNGLTEGASPQGHLATTPGGGVLRCLSNLLVTGPAWFLSYHLAYFLLFGIWFLIVWAIFGGAIARVAAVHVARDEKISVRQALRFSFSKILSFVFAPVIPLMIMLAAGLLMAAGGLLMYIPVIGPIIVGALFILGLVAAFVITLVIAGTAGGFNLMYPTIAVEGSDSFDAISRSFSYVFARPWRMIFYSLISLIYGALCFLFVRYFVYVMLSVAHFFTRWFLWGQPGRYWPEIWPPVSDQNLVYTIDYAALSWSEAIAATLIAIWVYIVLAFLAAFVISFYFSANTIIYYLMRREVDATEMDDVFIEETDEEFTEPASTPAITAESPSAPAPSSASPTPGPGSPAGPT